MARDLKEEKYEFMERVAICEVEAGLCRECALRIAERQLMEIIRQDQKRKAQAILERSCPPHSFLVRTLKCKKCGMQVSAP